MQIPVACTLSAGDARERSSEWRNFFETSVETAEMVPGGRLRLELKESSEVLAAAVDLAQREILCCAFFDFSILIEPERCWLVMGVPPDATSILRDFAGLLPAGALTSSDSEQGDRLTTSDS
jgi:hypothetical protein